MKKYEFAGEIKEVQVLFRKVILHRIKAVVAFELVEVGRHVCNLPNVKGGDARVRN